MISEGENFALGQRHSFTHSKLCVAKVLLKWKGIEKDSDIDINSGQKECPIDINSGQKECPTPHLPVLARDL